ncbi:MAG: hypothetical protein KDA89_03045 [Planctomycetaceae bacterium]|nr:hypothetical protein [Planctomycetaceae bacterium]
MSGGKWGGSHAGAMFRQGLRELRAAMYPESNIAQQTEYGIFGTKTPGEVAQGREGNGREFGEEAKGSSLADKVRAAEARTQDSKPMEMER